MSALIAYLLVVGVLLGVTARAAEEVLRLAQRPVRWAWAGALAMMLVLAARATAIALSPEAVGPDPALPHAVQPARVEVDAAPLAGVLIVARRAQKVVGEIPEVVALRIAPAIPLRFANGFAVAWVAASLAMFVFLAFVYGRLSRMVRSLPITTLHGNRVHVAGSAGPAVVGVLAPRIVVPAWLLRAPEEEQRLVLTHEREHLDARDPQLLITACVAAAAIPWHPAAWWMLSRLRLALEMDCDRRVLATGIARRSYGSTLIDIAARGGPLPFGAPALTGHPTQLERRLIAMAPAPTPYRRPRLLAAGACLLITVAAACEARLPSSPEIDAMDASAVENNPLTKATLAGDTAIAYYVDGSRVTAEASRKVVARDIATIEVKKGVAGNEIRIMTKAAAGSPSSDPAVALSRDPQVHAESVLGDASPEITTMRPLAPDFAGLILIDGTPADGRALARLGPDRIVSVEVIKGGAARRIYDDPRAANGVVRVTTKP